MKGFVLTALLLPLLFACEKTEEPVSATRESAPAMTPAPPTAAQPAPPPAPPAAPQPSPNASRPSGESATPPGGGASGASGEDSVYTVAAGDTLSSIARKHGVTQQDLVKWNNIKDPDRIYPGQAMRLSEPD